jgi:hypothetical protein
MKISKYICLVASRLLIPLIAPDAVADTAPTPADFGKTALELWQTKKYGELERVLTAASRQFPKRCVSIIGAAFVDRVYRGEYEESGTKLASIQVAIKNNKIVSTKEFDGLLAWNIWMASTIDEARTKLNRTKEDVKRDATPENFRALYGSKVPDLLQMIAVAPDADIP